MYFVRVHQDANWLCLQPYHGFGYQVAPLIRLMPFVKRGILVIGPVKQAQNCRLILHHDVQNCDPNEIRRKIAIDRLNQRVQVIQQKHYPKVFGFVAMFPAADTHIINIAEKIVNRDVRLDRFNRPRLYFNRRRESGNCDITVNHTNPNLIKLYRLLTRNRTISPTLRRRRQVDHQRWRTTGRRVLQMKG